MSTDPDPPASASERRNPTGVPASASERRNPTGAPASASERGNPTGAPVSASEWGNEYTRRVEAVLFAAAEPLSPADIRSYAGDGDLGAALDQLARDYARRGINLVQRGQRWHFQTAPDCAHLLARTRDLPRKLSRAALETLAIIAYHEPVTRAEIEEIRGVQVSPGTLDTLMETGWIRPAGRRESPGRPLQYASTPDFLTHFGLAGRRDLPGLADLKAAGLLEPLTPAEDAPAALAPEADRA